MVRTRLSQLSSQVSEETVPTASSIINDSLNSQCSAILLKIQGILAKKAPDCIPLVNELVTKISSFSSELDEKRKRSIVLYGVEEADKGLTASDRQKHTEEQKLLQTSKQPYLQRNFSEKINDGRGKGKRQGAKITGTRIERQGKFR
ncbi:hypothetical protein ANCDUO_05761 [Ancylostoma duodenale]|uniref:Uncharacterized protein n=1 Tax=Ancylostoma duodenale TaxID=51022 RepID=A0A0C2D3C6_9BILA|nr:hypothetical protein ANCDUO_05761 [Ancylostoma duodenale]